MKNKMQVLDEKKNAEDSCYKACILLPVSLETLKKQNNSKM